MAATWYWYFQISQFTNDDIFYQDSLEAEPESAFKNWARNQINVVNSDDKSLLRKLLRTVHGQLDIFNQGTQSYPLILLSREGQTLPPTTEDFVVYQGGNHDEYNAVLTCTSYDREIAEQFREENEFLWIITIKRGTYCIFLGDGGSNDEKEVLLLPGSMEITETTGNDIYATYVN